MCAASLVWFVWMQASCDYKQRFFIKLDEGRTFPCVGVSQFTFILEAIEEGQEEIVQHKAINDISQLFWHTDTGKCSMPNGSGIPLKKIPYGGQRQLIIKAYDSSGREVSVGTSPPFLLEATGSNVQDTISMELRRQARILTGTLIIRFVNPLPQGTDKVEMVLQAHSNPGGQNLPEESRGIPINTEEPPGFVIVTDIPPASGRKLKLHAKQGANTLQSSLETSYTIESGNPGKFVARVAISFTSQ